MKKSSGLAVKKRIRAAALKLFSTRGIEGTSIRDIVLAARTTQPMLYYYFNSKEALYLDIFDQLSKELLGELSRILSGKKGLWRKLAELFTFYQGYFSAHAVIAGFILRSILTKPKETRLQSAVTGYRNQYQELINRTLEESFVRGEFKAGRITAATELINAVLLYFLFSSGKENQRGNPVLLPAKIAEVVRAGIGGNKK